MSADDDLINRIPDGGIFAGTIASVDQASLTCMVLLPEFDGGRQQQGPCPYLLAGASTHPRRDQSCVVLEDARGGMWVAAWRPGEVEPFAPGALPSPAVATLPTGQPDGTVIRYQPDGWGQMLLVREGGYWEPVGAAPTRLITGGAAPLQPLVAGVYTPITGSGIPTPAAGDYVARANNQLNSPTSSAGNQTTCVFALDGSEQSSLNAFTGVSICVTPGRANTAWPTRAFPFAGLAAGVAVGLAAHISTTSGIASVAYWTVELTPKRLVAS